MTDDNPYVPPGCVLERGHDQHGSSTAVFSTHRAYRYSLTRRWADGLTAAFVMLNPSTADAHKVDPTVRRCIGFAQAWGCGGLLVLNAFALRSTDPRELLRVDDPVGPHNDSVILREVAQVQGPLIAAWSGLTTQLGRDAALRYMLRDRGPQCLGVTKGGYPRHPLYLPADTKPIPLPAFLGAAG